MYVSSSKVNERTRIILLTHVVNSKSIFYHTHSEFFLWIKYVKQILFNDYTRIFFISLTFRLKYVIYICIL